MFAKVDFVSRCNLCTKHLHMNNQFKGFDDLVFKEVTSSSGLTLRAELKFDNGYGVSVLTGQGSLTTKEKPYELAVLQRDENGVYKIVYPSVFNYDVIACITSEEITCYMKIIQSFPKPKLGPVITAIESSAY